MDDVEDLETPDGPDEDALYGLAETQHGYFTAAQARTCGYGWALLSHHAKRGRFIRLHRGLYRLRHFPTSPVDEIAAAWVGTGEHAVVSHESALYLHELSDIIPRWIHLTVDRRRRHLRPLPGVKLHTRIDPPRRGEVVER